MSKYVKNITQNPIIVAGISIPADSFHELKKYEEVKFAFNFKLESQIDNDIVLGSSDGVNLLTKQGSKDLLLSPNTAATSWFENSQANLPGDPKTVQEAILSTKNFRIQPVQFQFIGQMNHDQYLYSGAQLTTYNQRRSGNAFNGYRYGNSAPLTALYTGKVVSAVASITGIAVSTGSPAASVQLKFELWKVGFNSEGTKLGDVLFNINSSTYTLGTYWNSWILTSFAENQPQDVNVTAGDLLALKFIRQQSNSTVVAVRNATIVLEIEGNAS